MRTSEAVPSVLITYQIHFLLWNRLYKVNLALTDDLKCNESYFNFKNSKARKNKTIGDLKFLVKILEKLVSAPVIGQLPIIFMTKQSL